MKTYVITFSKLGIRDGWVEVAAHNEEIARAFAKKEYGVVWSGIYPIDQWLAGDAECFPLGCIGTTDLHYEHASHV